MQLLVNKITRKTLIKIIIALGILFLPIIALLSFFLYFNGRIYPNITLAEQDVGGRTVEEAKYIISSTFSLPETIKL